MRPNFVLRLLVVGVLFAVSLTGPGASSAEAQGQSPGAGAFPVIAVFHPDLSMADLRGLFRSEARFAANPAAWDYVDRGAIGLTQALESAVGFRADHVFSATVRGFSARLTARQIQQLESSPLIQYVEPDEIMTTQAQVLPWGIDRIDADISSTLAGNGSGQVSNVHVYILDTGIATHSDLNRVGHVNFVGGQNSDCHGHGTHVAGTASARDNTIDVVGAAPGARLVGVKVLGCSGSGSTSGIIKGVDWVTANAIKPAVANMSLGGGVSTALDDAVKRSADSGVFYALAAGNSGINACNASPARAGTHNGVMTVAATDINNQEASWSNYGSCVDIWAPGVSILSTRRGGGTTTMSGTSMASPHAAGTGALFLSGQTLASAATVEAVLKQDAVSTGTKSKDGRDIWLLSARRY